MQAERLQFVCKRMQPSIAACCCCCRQWMRFPCPVGFLVKDGHASMQFPCEDCIAYVGVVQGGQSGNGPFLLLKLATYSRAGIPRPWSVGVLQEISIGLADTTAAGLTATRITLTWKYNECRWPSGLAATSTHSDISCDKTAHPILIYVSNSSGAGTCTSVNSWRSASSWAKTPRPVNT